MIKIFYVQLFRVSIINTCIHTDIYRPLSRRLDRCDRVIQNESRDPFGGNVYYFTMQITFLTRKFRNGERNLHCDIVHITTKWVSSLTLDCNGVFAIKAYSPGSYTPIYLLCHRTLVFYENVIYMINIQQYQMRFSGQ